MSQRIMLHLSGRPAAGLMFAFSSGILLSLLVRRYLFEGFVTAGACFVLASFLARKRGRLVCSWLLALASVCICGLLMSAAHRDAYPESDLRSLLEHKQFPIDGPVTFDACVIESETRGEEILATVEMKSFVSRERWSSCRGKGILTVPVRGLHHKIRPGDALRGWATWQTPRNFHNPGSLDRSGLLMRRDIYLLGRVKSHRLLEALPGGCTNPLINFSNMVRGRVETVLGPMAKEGGQSSAILSSLVIGDYSGLDEHTQEAFQNSGTLHVLVVSGLHVAWLSGVLLQLFRSIRVPERIRYLVTASVIFLYTCVVGFQASITRCLWMFLLYLMGRSIMRRTDAVNILLVSALILLALEPDWLFEAGFQLSFISVLAISLTAAPAINDFLKPVCEPSMNCGRHDRLFLTPGLRHRAGRRIRIICEISIEGIADSTSPVLQRVLAWICRIVASAGFAAGSMFVASVAVQIWLEPVLAHYFNRMSWISPAANVAVVPFSSLVLASGIVAVIAGTLPGIGSVFTGVAGWLSSLLLSCAELITHFPGAWQRCPTPSAPWVFGGVLLLALWTILRLRSFWIPCSYIAALLACLSFGSIPAMGSWLARRGEQPWPRKAQILSLTFLDVGEGDSTVIRFPDGRVWLVDTGGLRQNPRREGGRTFDIGEAVVSRYLWHEWITRLDALIISHSDIDHAGGAATVLRNFPVGRVDYSRPVSSDPVLIKILDAAGRRKATARLVCSGMRETVGQVEIKTLNPPAGIVQKTSNETSVVLLVSYRNFSGILTGDLEKSAELRLAAQQVNLRSQLLKVAHHGSRWSTSGALLDRTRPRWGVISVGRNPFGHPAGETLARLQLHGTRPLPTQKEGAVTFETDGSRYVIKTHLHGIVERGELQP